MTPTRRDLHFQFDPDKLPTWASASPHVSHFLNSLSILFPEGEQFFINSVRHYRDQGRIDDPELLTQIRAFIGQEAMHGREHRDYNAALAEAGYDVERMEGFVTRLLEFTQKILPPRMNLSGTIALEHITAIMADGILRHRELFDDADPEMAAAWTWHALEETEHKGVAFDTFRAIQHEGPRDYLVRASGLLLATAILVPVATGNYLRMLRTDGELTNLKGWRKLYQHLRGPNGAFDRIGRDWLSYFRPGFHPWQHDNSQFLEQIPELESEFARAA